MMKKRLLIISILILIGFIPKKIYGFSTGGGASFPSGGGGGYVCVVGRAEGCGITDVSWEEELTLAEDLYDVNGNYLGESLPFQRKTTFTAGRFIGIDAYEKYWKKFTVSINPWCYNNKYDCYREVEDSYRYFDYYKWEWVEVKYSYSKYIGEYYECPGGSYGKNCHDVGCTPPSVSSCRGEAESRLAYLHATTRTESLYNGTMQDVNDMTENTEEPTQYELHIPIEKTGQSITEDPEPSDRNSTIVWQVKHIRYTFNLPVACIDPQTGEVSYVGHISEDGKMDYTNSANDCPKGQIRLEEITTIATPNNPFEGLHVGQYFIPLNATEYRDDGTPNYLRYNITPINDGSLKLPANYCKDLINRYDKSDGSSEYYKDFIMTSDRELLPENTSKEEDIDTVSKGCYASYLAKFRIKQKFYKPDGPNLKGYKFYYRPIDFRNPFPNTISDDSFWKPVYDSKSNAVTIKKKSNDPDNSIVSEKTIDLDDSFKYETYRTNENYKVETIRNYNELPENLYTSWQEMQVNGSSDFIDDGSNGITREKCDSVYPLGCGPANSNLTECLKKTEVCKK